MSEHQKLQEKRRKDYETIKVPYAHLKQVITGDETLEQTKVALEKFKTNKKLKAAALRFNPNLQRWLNVARDRIIRWERDHPKPEPEPEPKPEKEPEKEPESKPKSEEETPEEAAQPIGEETDTVEKVVEPEAEEKEPKPE